MAGILANLRHTVISGFILTLLIYIIVQVMGGAGILPDYGWWTFFFRWLHVLSGVMWIGLLWYFNFIQTPSMPSIPDEQKPAIRQGHRPRCSLVVPLGAPWQQLLLVSSWHG